MSILGIHLGHDSSLSIVKNNKLIANIAAERISRKKKAYVLTKEMLDYVLEVANETANNIELVVFNEYHQNLIEGEWLKFFDANNKKINTTGGQICFGSNIINNCYVELCGKKAPVLIIPHHLSHCASAFYTSKFDEAFVLSVDACAGFPMANSVLSYGKSNVLNPVDCPGIMAGCFYNYFTSNLGMGDPLYKAGSTMGWAAYGSVLDKVKNNLKEYLEKFFFLTLTKQNEVESVTWLWKELMGAIDKVSEENKYTPYHANVAATIQYLFEESILFALSRINNETKNLCLTGGSLLNCNVNTRILKESKFKNIHLFPGCGDDGLAAGSALWANHSYLNNPRVSYSNKDICYLGKEYGLKKIPDVDYIARKISQGKIIAWFEGRSEVGPRALGHRSILADPRDAHNRDRLNFMIKKREWFRPFAPSVLKEECDNWFDFQEESPFMLYTAKVMHPKAIPAVTHVDGSSRMQTVDKETNPNYYNLIKCFYERTGVPMVLNTSLNGKDEPILESEEDAHKFFDNVPVDMLVLNGEIYQR